MILKNWKKYWESQGNLSASNSETLQIWHYTLKKKRTLKILENRENTGKVREICQSEKV